MPRIRIVTASELSEKTLLARDYIKDSMGNVINMRRLNDGLTLSKEATDALLSEVCVEPQSEREVEVLPDGFKPAAEAANTYDIEKDQVWESLDPRHVVDGQPRQVRVVFVGTEQVLIEGLKSGRRTLVAIKRFCGKTRKGFKLVVPVAHDPPQLVEA